MLEQTKYKSGESGDKGLAWLTVTPQIIPVFKFQLLLCDQNSVMFFMLYNG